MFITFQIFFICYNVLSFYIFQKFINSSDFSICEYNNFL